MANQQRLDPHLLLEYVDDELDPRNRIEVAKHLLSEPDDYRQVEVYRRQNDLIRELYDPILTEPVPNALLRQLESRRRWPVSCARAAAVLLIVGAAFATGWFGRIAYNDEVQDAILLEQFMDQAFNAYSSYGFDTDRPAEVTTPRTVSLPDWFKSEMKSRLNWDTIDDSGYNAVGMRILPSYAGPAGQVVYRNEAGHHFTIFFHAVAVRGRRIAFPASSTGDAYFASRDKASMFGWIDHELVYAVVGAEDRKVLETILKTIRAAFPS